MPYLVFILLLYPLLELWILFKFASIFGFWTILFTSVLLMAFGASLIAAQSQKMLADFAQGKKINLLYLLNYSKKTFAGILIILPGFISFSIGVLFLIPITQKLLVNLILKIFNLDIKAQDTNFDHFNKQNSTGENYSKDLGEGRIIEGEIIEDKPNTTKRH